MSKPFEEITEAGFELPEQILEQPNTFPGDFFFDEPTVDGQLELLLKSKLVSLNDNDQLSITELGRAALKHHDYIKEQNILIQKQRTEELETFKSIANLMQQQLNSVALQADSTKSVADDAVTHAESAETQAVKADKTSKGANFKANISFIVSIISVIGVLLANADKIVHNLQRILSHLGMLK